MPTDVFRAVTLLWYAFQKGGSLVLHLSLRSLVICCPLGCSLMGVSGHCSPPCSFVVCIHNSGGAALPLWLWLLCVPWCPWIYTARIKWQPCGQACGGHPACGGRRHGSAAHSGASHEEAKVERGCLKTQGLQGFRFAFSISPGDGSDRLHAYL